MRRTLTTMLGTLLCAAALSACGSSAGSSSTATTASGASGSGSNTAAGTTASSTTSAHPGQPTRVVARLQGVQGTKASIATVRRFGHPTRSRFSAHLTGFAGLPLPQKLAALSTQVAELWQIAFRHAGAQLLPASVYLIDAQPLTCGSTQLTSSSSPDYCPATSSINLPLQFLDAKIAPLGDAALLLMVSDLYGLHVENALGLLSGSLTPAQILETASCFSGTSFDYAQYKHQLQPTDAMSVNKLLALEAPIAGSGSPAGAVTAADLTAAFNKGVLSGLNFQKCLPAGGVAPVK